MRCVASTLSSGAEIPRPSPVVGVGVGVVEYRHNSDYGFDYDNDNDRRTRFAARYGAGSTDPRLRKWSDLAPKRGPP